MSARRRRWLAKQGFMDWRQLPRVTKWRVFARWLSASRIKYLPCLEPFGSCRIRTLGPLRFSQVCLVV